MGFGTQASGSGGKGTTQPTLSEINVTPFVDVMLVLLIIFMVSAPLMQQGLQVNLPKVEAGSMDETPDEIVLTVKKNQRILMNSKKVKKGTLLKKLREIAKVKPEVQVFVKADEKVPYGFIARVIAEVKKAQIHRVGLVTQPASKKAAL